MNPAFDLFKTKAEAVSTEVHRFPTKAGALDFILQQLQQEGIADAPPRYAVWADCPFLAGLDKPSLCGKVPGLKFEVTRKFAANSKIGITQMNWGKADTGTLVQDSAAVEQRLASTLPAIHIALLETGQILPDLASVLQQTKTRNSPYIAMITGPSRTADIERVLTIGVHGPKRLIVVCVDDLKGVN